MLANWYAHNHGNGVPAGVQLNTQHLEVWQKLSDSDQVNTQSNRIKVRRAAVTGELSLKPERRRERWGLWLGTSNVLSCMNSDVLGKRERQQQRKSSNSTATLGDGEFF